MVELTSCEGQVPTFRPATPAPDQSTDTQCIPSVSDHSVSAWQTGDNALDNKAADTNNDSYSRRRRRRRKIIGT